jgi:tetratricopeptide (TPR) repeat protein
MKKLILSATLLLSVATFAQKDELKALKKIYAKEEITDKDLEAYKAASDALQGLAVEESDKVYAKFYKVMYPTVVLASKGAKATPQEQMGMYTPTFVKEYGAVIDETIAFEKKSGKKIYTDDLIIEKSQFKQTMTTMGLSLNTAKKYKEAAAIFYNLYLFDKITEGKALQNAAILSVQGEDYTSAVKYYEELEGSDYLNNGVIYFAVNKATGNEEEIATKADRDKFLSLNLYEKPRDYKVSEDKPEIMRILALLYKQNNEFDKAKDVYSRARILAPANEELKKGEFELYYGLGYNGLNEEEKLVNEINASRADKKKFDALMAKRKQMFLNTIPNFEKAYELNPTDANTKSILKMAYEVTGQADKAKAMQ